MDITEFFVSIKIPVTIFHVLSVILGMGGALISDLLFSFFSKDKKLSKTELSTLAILSSIVFYSLIFIIISGLFIFLSDIAKYLNSAKFLAKMSILAVLLVNGYVLNKSVWSHLFKKDFFISPREKNVRRFAFTCGAVSVISWLSVATLGVSNSLNMSYASIMLIYLTIIFFGILVALFVEKKEFN